MSELRNMHLRMNVTKERKLGIASSTDGLADELIFYVASKCHEITRVYNMSKGRHGREGNVGSLVAVCKARCGLAVEDTSKLFVELHNILQKILCLLRHSLSRKQSSQHVRCCLIVDHWSTESRDSVV